MALSAIFFWLFAFIIFWGNIGYPLSILILGKLTKKKNKKLKKHFPSVTVMVVAHNEEKVINEKLINLKKLNYPEDKIHFLVASDNSTDNTNEIVEKFINENPEMDLKLYKAEKRMGKTNAQNEAQKTVRTDYLVMTDSNSMLHPNAVQELMSSFSSDEISYVTGKLVYLNPDSSDTSQNESLYWSLDLKIREIESDIQTITAGNGAIYAVRNNRYYDFNPIKSHDSSMPIYYGLKGERAIANHDAIAYEKAGETTEDEYGRKVRMNRVMLEHILPDIRILNIFRYKWFTYFYLGHRTARYLLWISHLMVFLTSLLLTFSSVFYKTIFLIQFLFWCLVVLRHFFKIDNKIVNLIYYYGITIIAQWHGVINKITGKTKPFWEKAETTR